MKDERMAILKMLEEGKITVDESINLLKNLSKPEEQQDNQNAPRYQYTYEWIDELRENIVESAKNISDFITSQDFSFFDYGKPMENISYVSNNLAQGINSIILNGKNDKVEIVGYNEDSIKIEARYRLKNNFETQLKFKEENGNLELTYEEHALNSVGLKIKVPKRKIKNLYIKNKNASISLDDIIFEKAEISTKNASIYLNDIKAEEILLETKNSPISINDTKVDLADIRTTNAGINLKDTEVNKLSLRTSNATIKVSDTGINTAIAKTSNAKISFKDINILKHGQTGVYSLEAITTNGPINIELPSKQKVPVRVRASTFLGNIKIDTSELIIDKLDKNCINARSNDYDEASEKIDLRLETTNAKIDVSR